MNIFATYTRVCVCVWLWTDLLVPLLQKSLTRACSCYPLCAVKTENSRYGGRRPLANTATTSRKTLTLIALGGRRRILAEWILVVGRRIPH